MVSSGPVKDKQGKHSLDLCSKRILYEIAQNLPFSEILIVHEFDLSISWGSLQGPPPDTETIGHVSCSLGIDYPPETRLLFLPPTTIRVSSGEEWICIYNKN